MPQTSDELRAKMDSYFHNGGVNDWEPLAFLLDEGWGEKGGMLSKPTDHEPSNKEWDCAQFLIEEWDFAYE